MLINYESYIPVGSSIIGKTIKEVESLFSLKIDHYHNPPLEIGSSQMKATPDVVLKVGMFIKICEVDSEILAKFCRYFDLP